MKITLPFPPATLSGHAEGKHFWAKSKVTAEWRALARYAASGKFPDMPPDGDIQVLIRFIPANKRGDRVNFPNRCKPIYDGIADALGVNDKRFLPSFEFCPPEAPGRIEVEISTCSAI